MNTSVHTNLYIKNKVRGVLMRVVDAINIILPVATGFLGMIIQSI